MLLSVLQPATAGREFIQQPVVQVLACSAVIRMEVKRAVLMGVIDSVDPTLSITTMSTARLSCRSNRFLRGDQDAVASHYPGLSKSNRATWQVWALSHRLRNRCSSMHACMRKQPEQQSHQAVSMEGCLARLLGAQFFQSLPHHVHGALHGASDP